jgi:hypothetical protein
MFSILEVRLKKWVDSSHPSENGNHEGHGGSAWSFARHANTSLRMTADGIAEVRRQIAEVEDQFSALSSQKTFKHGGHGGMHKGGQLPECGDKLFIPSKLEVTSEPSQCIGCARL